MPEQTDEQLRSDAYLKMLDVLRPYRGRIISEWHDEKKNAVYLCLLCSRQEGACDDRPFWQGTVLVNIVHNGATFFHFGEDLMMLALGIPRSGGWGDIHAILNRISPPVQRVE